MSAWHTVWLVAKREVVTRKRAFLISTSIILALVVMGLLAQSSPELLRGPRFRRKMQTEYWPPSAPSCCLAR